MYVRKKKVHPFKPTSVGQGFASAEDLFSAKSGPARKEPELDEKAFKDSIRDAETGEAIDISKAGWNVVEGRLNLNTKTILAMGTGRLDIKTRVEQLGSPIMLSDSRPSTHRSVYSRQSTAQSDIQSPVVTSRTARSDGTADSDNLFFNSFNFKDYKQSSRQVLLKQHAVLPSIMDLQRPEPGYSPAASPVGTARYSEASFRGTALARDVSSPLSVGSAQDQPSPSAPHRRHPLLSKFMKEGPLSPMHHKDWDARTNTVLTVGEDGEPLDQAEDGVDFSDSEASDGGDSKDKTKARTMRSNSIVSALASVNSSSVGSTEHSKGSQSRRSKGTKHASGGHSVASSHTSKSSSTIFKGDNTIGQVDPSIVVTNRKHWQGVEERLFQELYSLGWQYEHNKSLTGEEAFQGGLAAVRQTARAIARLKVKAMKELVQACADEKIKEAKRAALESENAGKRTYLLELVKVHEEERKKARRYLHALEQDSEIILIRSLNEIGWLW